MTDPQPANGSVPRSTSIMNRIVSTSLRQGFIVVLMTLMFVGAG